MNGRLRRTLFENFALKVISLALAVLLYVLLRSVQAHDIDGTPAAKAQQRNHQHLPPGRSASSSPR
jgi:hypothetical protein